MTTQKSPQPAQEPKATQVKKPDAALDEKQLDKVTGGSLYNACCTGKHFPSGTSTT